MQTSKKSPNSFGSTTRSLRKEFGISSKTACCCCQTTPTFTAKVCAFLAVERFITGTDRITVILPASTAGDLVIANFVPLSSIPPGTANSTLSRATVVDSVACVANGPCVLSISADGNETSLGNDGRPIFELYQWSANQRLTLLATAGGTTIERLVDGIQVAAAPITDALAPVITLNGTSPMNVDFGTYAPSMRSGKLPLSSVAICPVK